MLALLLALAVQDVDALTRDLSHEDLETRTKAADEIVKLGPKAVPAMVALIDAADEELAGQARGILKAMGNGVVLTLDGIKSERARALADSIVREKALSLIRAPACEVKIGNVPRWNGLPELELGTGSGHGGSLSWHRFAPGARDVRVLHVSLVADRTSYKTPWPADNRKVEVKQAVLALDDFRLLIRLGGAISAATVTMKPTRTMSSSSADFWSMARASSADGSLFDLDYCGYPGTGKEASYASNQAIVALALDGLKPLEFKECPLSDADRVWATGRFTQTLKREKEHGWIRERAIIIVGTVGDATALPHLRTIMMGDVDRNAYFAINAITRLLGTDVRPQPIEHMDVLETRKKIAELLDGRK